MHKRSPEDHTFRARVLRCLIAFYVIPMIAALGVLLASVMPGC